jgi:hypothetical protein
MTITKVTSDISHPIQWTFLIVVDLFLERFSLLASRTLYFLLLPILFSPVSFACLLFSWHYLLQFLHSASAPLWFFLRWLHLFPIAAVTNYHKFSSLEPYSSGHQNSKMDLTEIKIKVSEDCISFGSPLGKICVFQLLGLPHSLTKSCLPSLKPTTVVKSSCSDDYSASLLYIFPQGHFWR